MSWLEANMGRNKNALQAMESASQIKKRGTDTAMQGLSMLQGAGTQLGQWEQEKKKQYRDEWAKAYAKDPSIGTFDEWYKKVSGKQPLTEILKGTNLGSTLSGGQPTQTSALPGAGYETAFTKMTFEEQAKNQERKWQEHVNQEMARGRDINKLSPDDYQKEYMRVVFGYEPKDWAAGGYTTRAEGEPQSFNELMKQGWMYYEGMNKIGTDEMGNPTWVGEPPTKEELVNSLMAQERDNPLLTRFLGTTDQKQIRKRVTEWVDNNYREVIVEEVAPEPIPVEKKGKLNVYKGIKYEGEAKASQENIIRLFDAVDSNINDYKQDYDKLTNIKKQYEDLVRNNRIEGRLAYGDEAEKYLKSLNRELQEIYAAHLQNVSTDVLKPYEEIMNAGKTNTGGIQSNYYTRQYGGR